MEAERRRIRISAYLVFAALVGVLQHGCTSEPVGPRNELEKYDAHVATAWFGLINQVIQSEHLSPLRASRIYAYAGVTLYESAVTGLETHRSLVGQLNGLDSLPRIARGTAYHWPTVASSALAAVTRHLLADASTANLEAISALEQQFADEFSPQAGGSVFRRSVDYGHAVGEAIFLWAFADGYATLHDCAYTPPAGTSLWVPTPPDYRPALEPCWGQLRPFALKLPSDCHPDPPLPYDRSPLSPFYREMREVYDTVNHLTAEQRAAALFWADDPGETATSAGHWISILGQIVDSNACTLDVAIEAYARLGIALGDAVISCWRAKYAYNLARPVTFIRDFVDPEWSPDLTTPPSPEYTSEQAVQASAAANVLTEMFGHTAFVDHTHDNRGLPSRSFTSFYAAATEAGLSGLYAGVHFRTAIDNGITQGTCIGTAVDELRFTAESK